MYFCLMTVSNCMKQNLVEFKGEIDLSAMVFGELKSSLLID